MPRLEPRPGPGTPFGRIMAHRNDINQAWNALDEKIRFTGLLPPVLKEEVRRALSQESGCKFCASLGCPQAAYEDARTTAAVEFARALARQPSNVTDETFAILRPHFTDQEIVELCCWAAFMYASEMFGGVFKLDPATEGEKTLYDRWLKQGFAAYEKRAASA